METPQQQVPLSDDHSTFYLASVVLCRVPAPGWSYDLHCSPPADVHFLPHETDTSASPSLQWWWWCPGDSLQDKNKQSRWGTFHFSILTIQTCSSSACWGHQRSSHTSGLASVSDEMVIPTWSSVFLLPLSFRKCHCLLYLSSYVKPCNFHLLLIWATSCLRFSFHFYLIHLIPILDNQTKYFSQALIVLLRLVFSSSVWPSFCFDPARSGH